MKDQRYAVIVSFRSSDGESCSTSAVAFGQEEAQSKRKEMQEQLKSEGCKVFHSSIVEDKPKRVLHGM